MRKHLTRHLPSLLAVCTLALPAGALAQSRDLVARGERLDRVAAIVNDGVVLQSTVDAQIAQVVDRFRSQGQPLPPLPILRQQVLDRLVLQEVQLQRAERLGIEVSDEQLNGALREVADRNKIDFDKMPEAIASQGLDYASYRDDMRKEITLQVLRGRDVLQRIYVSPREVDQYLARQSNNRMDNQEFDVSHILLSLPEAATAEDVAQIEAKARELVEKANAGEEFGRLALQYSQAQSALERGKLGWRKGSQLPQFIAEAVVNLQPGQVSAPLRTATGIHIVRLDDRRSVDQPMMVEQVHARHILLKPNEVQDDALTKQKLTEIRARILKGEDFAAIARVTSEDPGSGSQGGDLGWTSPGTFVLEFDQVLAALKENEISEPFRTQFGWHIVQLLGHRTHDQSDEMKHQRAYAAVRESKSDEETELWLRRLRDEAYVEYKVL
jgi:peptidyl-prolyl cis-trans isomerase SurA